MGNQVRCCRLECKVDGGMVRNEPGGWVDLKVQKELGFYFKPLRNQ